MSKKIKAPSAAERTAAIQTTWLYSLPLEQIIGRWSKTGADGFYTAEREALQAHPVGTMRGIILGLLAPREMRTFIDEARRERRTAAQQTRLDALAALRAKRPELDTPEHGTMEGAIRDAAVRYDAERGRVRLTDIITAVAADHLLGTNEVLLKLAGEGARAVAQQVREAVPLPA